MSTPRLAQPSRTRSTRSRNLAVLAIAGCAALAAVLGFSAGRRTPAAQADPPGMSAGLSPVADESLAALRAAVEDGARERDALRTDLAAVRSDLAALRPEIAALRASLPKAEAAAAVATAEGDLGPTDPKATARDDRSAFPAPGRPETAGPFDAGALEAAGVHPADVSELREQWEAFELEKLYLSDEATREGWLRSRRYREALSQTREDFRGSVDDEDWDRVLYATGQTNRVVVSNVIGGSAASAAGLEGGDVILAYDGVHIFRPSELRNGTVAGRPGEWVPIQVLRDGRPIDTRVPRGPLGVHMTRARRTPR